jgi:hypothetical protein
MPDFKFHRCRRLGNKERRRHAAFDRCRRLGNKERRRHATFHRCRRLGAQNSVADMPSVYLQSGYHSGHGSMCVPVSSMRNECGQAYA